MKKITLGLFVAGISAAVIALSGCGGSSGAAAPAPTPTPTPTSTPIGGSVIAPGGVLAYAPSTFGQRLAKLICDTAYALTGAAVPNAAVAMYNINTATGLPVGAPVAGPTTTDAAGHYTLNVPAGTAPKPTLQVLIYAPGTVLSTTGAPAAAPAMRTIPTSLAANAVANVDPASSLVSEMLRQAAVAAGGDFAAVNIADVATMSATILADPAVAAAIATGAPVSTLLAQTAALTPPTVAAAVTTSIATNPVKTARFVLNNASATGMFTYDMTRNSTYRFLSNGTALNTRVDVASGTTVVVYAPANGAMTQISQYLLTRYFGTASATSAASSTNLPVLISSIDGAGQMVFHNSLGLGTPRIALPTTLAVGAAWTATGGAGYINTASTTATFRITAIGGTRTVTSSIGAVVYTDVVTVTVNATDYSLGVPMTGTGTIYISPSKGGIIEQSTTVTGQVTPPGMGAVPAGAVADASVTETLILR